VEKYGTVGQATDVNIIRRMRLTCWITKGTDTHSEYVVRIVFPRQQWLRERALILRVYVPCLCCVLYGSQNKQRLLTYRYVINVLHFTLYPVRQALPCVGF
jgi:hypothetical protein